jgi:hypothetical protein
MDRLHPAKGFKIGVKRASVKSQLLRNDWAASSAAQLLLVAVVAMYHPMLQQNHSVLTLDWLKTLVWRPLDQAQAVALGGIAAMIEDCETSGRMPDSRGSLRGRGEAQLLVLAHG